MERSSEGAGAGTKLLRVCHILAMSKFGCRHGWNAAFCSRRPRKKQLRRLFLCHWNESSFSESFYGCKTQKTSFKVLRRRTGLFFCVCACFAPQNRQKREGSRGFVRILRFCLCVWSFREKKTHRFPGLIKFPMPANRPA